MKKTPKYKTIDLFAGAGGLSCGFLMAEQYKIVAAAEINENARKTYLKNITKDDDFVMINNVIDYDFKELNKRFDGIDVVIGGPPCQGFSNANRNKSHLISMNNALVKEFFRAIKEIKPKAFVMENVSMLQSDKHRFYESKKDSQEIEQLISKGFAIPKREDTVFIAPYVYEELDLDNLSDIDVLLLPEDLFHILNVFLKNMSNDFRMGRFFEKNRKGMINAIRACILTNKAIKAEILARLDRILWYLVNKEAYQCYDDLNYLVSVQKSIRLIKEIQDNQLIGEYCLNENGELVYKVNSYSVIDYINAILGGEYYQYGNTVYAEKYGVPQERRRFIVIGVRKGSCDNDECLIPEGNPEQKIITVGEAIGDLEKYIPSVSLQSSEIEYLDDEDGISSYAKEMRRGSKTIKNHIITKTTEKALSRYKMIDQGKNFHSLPSEQKDTYSKPERTQNTIYLRLDPNKPCGTVVNVRKSMWIHPNLDRAISVREAARLQSFPDKFEFIGTKDSQYQQVGNAVPPLLAKEIALYLLKYLQNI